ncbi:amino acid adenylation domain-containing protein [Streptomyces sp. NPDC014684]|uniref:amino acid adenylation domain-containing protein n=1 Tax=Streptomyces sp. NPDC014684 TaxID=3364880 RepID=UPI003702FE7F
MSSESLPLARGSQQTANGARQAQGPAGGGGRVGGFAPTAAAAVRLRGRLDTSALQDALSDVVGRHEALRTGITSGPGQEPVRVVHPPDRVAVEFSGDDVGAREVEARLARVPDGRTDPGSKSLLRAELWRVRDAGGPAGAPEWIVLMRAPEAVADTRSMEILLADLAAAYRARLAGRRPDPVAPPTPPHAARVRERQAGRPVREAQAGRSAREGQAYWARRLAGAAPLQLPTDRPVTPGRSGHGAAVPAEFPADLADALRALAEAEGTDLFTVLLSATAVVLGGWSGRTDVVIGVPVPGRDADGPGSLVGDFAGVVPLRVGLAGGEPFRQLLRRTDAARREDLSHADTPAGPHGAGGGPDAGPTLAQALLALRGPLPEPPRFPGLESEWLGVPASMAGIQVRVELAPTASGALTGSLVHATDLFDGATAQRLVESLLTVCRAVARAPDSPAPPPLMSDAQHRLITTGFSGAGRFGPSSPPVHAWFEQRADEAPDRVAVIADIGGSPAQLSYRELEERANQVAWWLRGRGVGAEDRIGVHLNRGLDLVCVLLGIFKAGATYVPLDPQSPPERLDHVVRDAAPLLCLSDSGGDPPSGGGVTEVVPFGDARARFAACPVKRPPAGALGAGAACLIYTSGSTGRPKGVVVTHAGLANQLGWLCESMGFGPDDVTLHKTPTGSDPSLWEILVPLMSGGRLVLADARDQGDPAYLLDAHARYGVTACDFFPSLLRHFLAEPGVTERARDLRLVICGGEELNADLSRRFADLLPTAQLYNLYGPTEATIAVTFHQVTGRTVDPIPIGRPIPGTEIHVLDEHARPQPIGVPGELFIAGVQLARGYLGRPGQTADRFVPHPLSPGARLYRTGDRARWLADGALEYLGRLDHQVKIRGYRVEPAEVEAALTALPGVGQALVLARPAPGGGLRLVAYLTPSHPGAVTDTASLRRALARLLPSGAVPSAFVRLDSFPLTPVGKVDRERLPAPADGRRSATPAAPTGSPDSPTPAAPPDSPTAAAPPDSPTPPAPPTPPANEVQEVLRGIWSDALPAASPPGIHDTFSSLGGDLECAERVVSQIRALFRIELPARRVIEEATVERLAKLLHDRDPAKGDGVARTARLVLRVRAMSPDEITAKLRG